MTWIMDASASLAPLVADGRAYVTGALIKDSSTHLILGHLQPTRQLTQSILGMAMQGPLAPVELVSSLAQNFQLMKIQNMLETVQLVAGVGAAASVLNLGVSIGGFAMVLSSLKRMEGTLGQVLNVVHGIRRAQTADFLGVASFAIDRAECAFGLTAAFDRRRYWEEADLELSRVIAMALKRLAAQGLNLERLSDGVAPEPGVAQPLSRPESVELLRWLCAVSSARVEVLLCLKMPSEAARLSRTTTGWMKCLPYSAKSLAQAWLAGRPAAPARLTQLTAQAASLSRLIERVGSVAEERAWLCQNLHDRGIDTLEYVLAVRNDPVERVLMVAHVGAT